MLKRWEWVWRYYSGGGRHMAIESIGLGFVWSTLYYSSLKGGDLETIKEIMAKLGLYLLASISIFTTSIWRLLLTRTTPNRHRHTQSDYSFQSITSQHSSLSGRLSGSHGVSIRNSISDKPQRRMGKIRKVGQKILGILFSSRYTPLQKVALLTYHGLLLLGFYLYDRGVDFESHGAYNLLMFIMLAVPINLVIFGVLMWHRLLGRRRFVQTFCMALLFSSFIVIVRLGQLTKQNAKGFSFLGGGMMSCSSDECGQCQFPIGTPWFDLLPNRAQTFWTGSTTCQWAGRRSLGERNEAFHVALSPDGILKIQCPGKAEYAVMPDTRRWQLSDKQAQPTSNSLQDNILKDFNASKRPYAGQVQLEDHVDLVMATCENDSKLAIRVPNHRQKVNEKIERWSEIPHTSRPPNVLLIFMDAISRKQFFRRLPMTTHALELAVSQHPRRFGNGEEGDRVAGEVVDGDHLNTGQQPRFRLFHFFKYHVLGFNTGPNTRALFTGCKDSRPTFQPPIWNSFKEIGNYVTGSIYGHCEDWNSMYQSPHGYNYTVSTDIDFEFQGLSCLPEYEPVDWKDRGNFQGYTAITKRCVNGRHMHQWQIEYMDKFIDQFQKKAPWFLMTSFMEGHEGTGEVIGQIDSDLSDFIQRRFASGGSLLDNTIMFIVSDHGPHMGLNFLYLNDGAISHRSPFLSMLVPTPLLTPETAENMRLNQHRLLTAADIYATMRHILAQGSSINGNFDLHGETTMAAGERARPSDLPKVNQTSLFSEIPRNRKCSDVDVSDEACICL